MSKLREYNAWSHMAAKAQPTDYPDDKLIATANISNLKVLKPNGIEIKGQGTSISGMDNDFFEITILGISYPFFEEEFPHHVKAYNDQFKGS